MALRDTRAKVGKAYAHGKGNVTKVVDAASPFLSRSGSIVAAAKGNIFEFPVFLSSSVQLDYATAVSSLLEQVYASYLQAALSINPVIDAETARSGNQFSAFKSDMNKYVEYVDCVDLDSMPYADVMLEHEYVSEGAVVKFNIVSIEDSEARLILEASDRQPLSEFDHFFQEGKGDKRHKHKKTPGVNGARTNPQPASTTVDDTDDVDTNTSTTANTTSPSPARTNTNTSSSTSKKVTERERREWENIKNRGIRRDAEKQIKNLKYETKQNKKSVKELERQSKQNADEYVALTNEQKKIQDSFDKLDELKQQLELSKNELKESKQKFEDLKKAHGEAHADERKALDDEWKKLNEKVKQHEHDKKYDEDELTRQHKREDAQDKLAKERAEREVAEKERDVKEHEKRLREFDDKHRKLLDELGYDPETNTTRADRTEQRQQTNDNWKNVSAPPELIDDTKIKKLNTLKPLMMNVQFSILSDDGNVSRPINYVIGVKTHNRIVDADTLPEVVKYPLKEMDKFTRKAKWRAGELKFFKDIVFRIKEKKQTAIDSKDPRRKWYRRLYELAHTTGDAPAMSVMKGENIVKSTLVSQFIDTFSHGVIPDSTLVISNADVVYIKSETGIDLLNGSSAVDLCKELFLIGIVVVDTDAESIKMLLPDLHGDYEVHSLASVNKQLAELDTAGTKTRDIFKMLG